MPDDRPFAMALKKQAQLDMLGHSLKTVFKIGDSGDQFAQLLRALDRPEIAHAK
jgi:arginyl-tRNA synthetase